MKSKFRVKLGLCFLIMLILGVVVSCPEPSGKGKITVNFVIDVDENIGSTELLRESKARIGLSSIKIDPDVKQYGSLPLPTRDGWKFKGWYNSPTSDQVITWESKPISESDHNLYAQWEEREYTFTLNSNRNSGVKLDILDREGNPRADATGSSYSKSLSGVKYGEEINVRAVTELGFLFKSENDWNKPDQIKDDSEKKYKNDDSTETREAIVIMPNSNFTISSLIDSRPYTLILKNGDVVYRRIILGYDDISSLPFDLEKTGYELLGWSKEETLNPDDIDYEDKLYTKTERSVSKLSTDGSDVTLYAQWKAMNPTVTFDGNASAFIEEGNTQLSNSTVDFGGQEEEKTVVYNDYYGSLPVPNRHGWKFLGWFTDSTGGNRVSEYTEVLIPSNHTLYAHWEASSYTLSLVNNTGKIDFLEIWVDGSNLGNKASFKYGEKVSVKALRINYAYVFEKWNSSNGEGVFSNGSNAISDFVMPALNTELTVSVKPKEYTISYEDVKDEEIGSYKPDTYNVESADITIPQPKRRGYNFDGWSVLGYAGKIKDFVITNGTTGNINLKANWSVITYNITYELDGGTVSKDNPTSYTIVTSDITLNNPTKTGYDFSGWTMTCDKDSEGNITTPTLALSIGLGSIGNRVLKAHWNIILYDLTVKSYEGGGIATVNNSSSKTVNYKESIGSVVDITATVNDGYEFDKWTSSNGGLFENANSMSTKFTMPSNEVTVTAIAKPINYQISYTGIDDILQANALYKNYTIETATFELINPDKIGYTFLGWTGSNGSSAETSVVIPVGTIGDKNYTATWGKIDYSIIYSMAGGINNPDNPSTYTIEDTIELKEPTRPGYTFNGWIGEGSSTPNKNVVINKGTYGIKEYTANWSINSYKLTVTYSGNGISGVTGSRDKVEYRSEVRITASVKSGYKFSKWLTSDDGAIITNTNLDSTTLSYMPANDVTLTATAEPINYNIAYNLAGGNNNSDNPSTYTIEEKVELKAPTKSGYTFLGWTGSNGSTAETSVVIPVGTIGDKNYTATWEINRHTLRVVAGSNVTKVSTMELLLEFGTPTGITEISATEFDSGYEFDKWVISGLSGTGFIENVNNATTRISFSMPDNDVVITATAKKTI